MKSKEQKRKEAIERQSKRRSPYKYVPETKPFICGGYTQEDWDLLTMWKRDYEYRDYMLYSQDTLEDQYDLLHLELLSTKPSWTIK